MKPFKKSLILGFAVLGSIFAYMLFHTRETGFCNIYCGDLINETQIAFLFFYIILFFSLVTYKMPARIFVLWWTFAKFAIPLVFVLSLLINFGIFHSSSGTWQDMFDVPIIMLLYCIFILGSLIQIIRGYRI